VNPKPKLKHTP